MTTPTLLARAQALLQRRAVHVAALAIVPLTLAAQTAHAQVTLTSIEAGFIDVSGGRFAFGFASNNAGVFTAPSLFSFSSVTSAAGFSLTGDLHFNGTQNLLGSGEDIHFGPYVRYLTLTGTWDSRYTGDQSTQITLSGNSTFTGSMNSILLAYSDQAYNNTGFAAAVSTGAAYQTAVDVFSSFNPGTRGNFTLDLIYQWSPSPADASSLLDSTLTFGAATSAIPEPSTYAALLGAAALVGTVVVRRTTRRAV